MVRSNFPKSFTIFLLVFRPYLKILICRGHHRSDIIPNIAVTENDDLPSAAGPVFHFALQDISGNQFHRRLPLFNAPELLKGRLAKFVSGHLH